MSGSKEEALAYLTDLETAAAASDMPKGPVMGTVIKKLVAAAKMDDRQKHMRLPEAAFLNRYAIPVLFEHLQTSTGLSREDARKAFLNEYHRSMPETSSMGPISPVRHPFQKAIGVPAGDIYKKWINPKKGDGLTQSAPDFALRHPFPHSIVFEGKFYASGSSDYGARQLVSDLYQAFFYRGLPKTTARRKGGADWGYDYACLLAFDASKDGTLLGAWKALSPAIRKSFWGSANIYVMILRD
jgi:hypothetical protein